VLDSVADHTLSKLSISHTASQPDSQTDRQTDNQSINFILSACQNNWNIQSIRNSRHKSCSALSFS